MAVHIRVHAGTVRDKKLERHQGPTEMTTVLHGMDVTLVQEWNGGRVRQARELKMSAERGGAGSGELG